MRVLLVSANTERISMPTMPLGLALVVGDVSVGPYWTGEVKETR
jgi:hypothetical protein